MKKAIEDSYFSRVKEHVSDYKDLLQKRRLQTAMEHAAEAVELTLKGILAKRGKLTKEMTGWSRGHDLIFLSKKCGEDFGASSEDMAGLIEGRKLTYPDAKVNRREREYTVEEVEHYKDIVENAFTIACMELSEMRHESITGWDEDSIQMRIAIEKQKNKIPNWVQRSRRLR